MFHRLGQQHAKPNDEDLLEKISITIYVANFPSHLSVRELWNICSRAGIVADVFIGRSKNKQGQMFAFVRYTKGDAENIVKTLCTIRIGKLQLHANRARYPRQSGSKAVRRQVPKEVGKMKEIPKVWKMARPGGSTYAHVLAGEKVDPSDSKGGEDASSSSIEAEVNHDFSYSYALLGCYKDFRAIANTSCMCQGEVFLEVHPVYLGGLWVLLNFNSEIARNKFLNHSPFKTWFEVLKPWHNDFVIQERILWVEVEGVPLLAWCRSTFEKIASKWGDLVFLDESDAQNRFNMRMGIKTTHAPLVFESVFVTIQHVEYCVRIRELSSWTPTFATGFTKEDGGVSVQGEHYNQEEDGDSLKSCQEVDQNERQLDDFDLDDAWKGGVDATHEAKLYSQHAAEEDKVEMDSDPFNVGPLIDQVFWQKETKFYNPEKCYSDVPMDVEPIGSSSKSSMSAPPGFSLKGGCRLDVRKDGEGLPRTPVYGDGTRTPPMVIQDPPNGAQTGANSEVLIDVEVKSVAMEERGSKNNPFSIIEKLDSAIAVGQALGWDMTGCVRTLEKIIAENGDLKCYK